VDFYEPDVLPAAGLVVFCFTPYLTNDNNNTTTEELSSKLFKIDGEL